MKITMEIPDADLRRIGSLVSETKTPQNVFIGKTPPADGSEPLLVSVKKAAEMLSISRSQCYELVRAGTIPAVRLGRSIRVSYTGLLEFVKKLEGQGLEE